MITRQTALWSFSLWILMSLKTFATDHKQSPYLRANYLEKRKKQVKNQNGVVKGPSLLQVFSKYIPLLKSDLYSALEEIRQDFSSEGELVNIHIPGIQNIFIVSDPYDIVEITKLESKGALKKGFTINFIQRYLLGNGVAALESDHFNYKKLHSLIAPHFAKKEMSHLFEENKSWSLEFLESLGSKEFVDLEVELRIFAMGGISRAILDDPLSYQEACFLNESLHTIVNYTSYKQLNSPFVLPDWFPSPFRKEYLKAFESMKQKATSLLYQQDLPEDCLVAKIRKSSFSEKTKLDQIINLFFGGHETTANWLTMSFYRLLSNPKIYQKLKKEACSLSDHWGSEDLAPAVTPYLDAFLKEVLRLDSSIHIYGRDSVEGFYLGGFYVPAKSLIVLSQYHAHRNLDQWDHPDTFDPERFLQTSEKKTRV